MEKYGKRKKRKYDMFMTSKPFKHHPSFPKRWKYLKPREENTNINEYIGNVDPGKRDLPYLRFDSQPNLV